MQQMLKIDRLAQIPKMILLDLPTQVGRIIGGNQNGKDPRIPFAKLSDQVQTVHSREVQIDQSQRWAVTPIGVEQA